MHLNPGFLPESAANVIKNPETNKYFGIFLHMYLKLYIKLQHLDGVEIHHGGGEGHQGGVEAVEHATMTWQDISAVLDAEGTLEERLDKVAPGAEDDNGQSEADIFKWAQHLGTVPQCAAGA